MFPFTCLTVNPSPSPAPLLSVVWLTSFSLRVTLIGILTLYPRRPTIQLFLCYNILMPLATLKIIVGFVAILLTFIGYIPYSRDIIAGKTKPHLYSWFLWALVTAIVFALQFVGGAGVGGFVTLAAAIMCLVVIYLAYRHGATTDIKPIDKFFILLAFVALALWLLAKQPIWSVILSTLIDLFGFAPTIRKSWNNPHSETISFYYLNTFRFTLAVFALAEYSIVTALYPISWLLANGLFALMLLTRRRQLAQV